MAQRARSALFVLIAAKSHLINYSWVKRQKVAKFFIFFRFCWHLEDGKDTILFRISRRTIPLKISKSENQGKWPKIASEGAHPSQGELARIYGQPGNNCTHANIYTIWISQGCRLAIYTLERFIWYEYWRGCNYFQVTHTFMLTRPD